MRQKKIEKRKPRTVTLQGVMELIDYGDDLVPFDAVLLTDDEEEFYVGFPNMDSRLREYANKYVEITGSFFKKDEHKAIAAKRIIVIEDDADDSLAGSDNFQDVFDDYLERSYDEGSDLQELMRYSGRSSRHRYNNDF